MEKEIIQRNEIVSLLNNLRLKHLEVSIREKSRKFNLNGFITRADTNSITVFFDSISDIVPIKNLKVCFDYNRNFYTSSETSIRLLNLTLKSIEVLIPEILYFHAIRKFARVGIPDQIQISIKKIETIANETSANMNIDELPVSLRNIYMELKQETPDMKKVISMIGDELGHYSNRFKINLFKDLTSLSPIEKVVNSYKKTFWINDTDNLNNYIHIGDKYSVIGYEKYFELINKTMSPEILEKIRQNYISRGINSYAMVPILIGNNIIGVIEVSVPADPKFKALSISELFYIKGLADVLGEVVVKSKGGLPDSNASLNLLDISIGGILANTNNVYLTHSIKENSIVVLNILVDKKEIEARARVIRYHYLKGDNGGLNIAFEFLIDDEPIKNELSSIIKKYLKTSPESKV